MAKDGQSGMEGLRVGKVEREGKGLGWRNRE